MLKISKNLLFACCVSISAVLLYAVTSSQSLSLVKVFELDGQASNSNKSTSTSAENQHEHEAEGESESSEKIKSELEVIAQESKARKNLSYLYGLNVLDQITPYTQDGFPSKLFKPPVC